MVTPPAQNTNPRRTCVIGEADPFLAQLLQRFAEKSGLRTRLAQSGDAVLALTEQERPALIVVDPELPGKTRGWEAVKRLSSDQDSQAIPIILCAWLKEAEAQALVGLTLHHLQKPELHYADFLTALAASGLEPTAKHPARPR